MDSPPRTSTAIRVQKTRLPTGSVYTFPPSPPPTPPSSFSSSHYPLRQYSHVFRTTTWAKSSRRCWQYHWRPPCRRRTPARRVRWLFGSYKLRGCPRRCLSRLETGWLMRSGEPSRANSVKKERRAACPTVSRFVQLYIFYPLLRYVSCSGNSRPQHACALCIRSRLC